MKRKFFSYPERIEQSSLYGFSWMEYVTAIPSPLVAVSSYKSNGKPNVAMQSWCTFSGGSDGFYTIFANVHKRQHMYVSVREAGCLVVNFPSQKYFAACMRSIHQNDFDTDEIAASGLSAEPAVKVNAPRIQECFFEFGMRACLGKRAFSRQRQHGIVRKGGDETRYRTEKPGRYGETGYLYNLRSTLNPETGARDRAALGILQALPPYDIL